ncbi:MAG: pirin family protein [Nocardioidaceae bacterium]
MREVRRSADRFTTNTEWLTSRHSFSFGPHYDPANVGHALLVAHNEDLVAPGTGYDTHPHRDLEIVTWVLDGSLVHADDRGHAGTITPGLAQRMSAGAGIRHSERNDASDPSTGPAHFVQMWVRPRTPGGAPSYAQQEVGALDGAGLVALASGLVDAVVALNADATLSVARLAPGEAVQLPDAPYLHLFVARGAVDLEAAGRLETGDAVRFTADGGLRVTGAVPATDTATDTDTDTAEVLVWAMPADSA